MFAYCLNNPINYVDEAGFFAAVATATSVVGLNWWNGFGWILGAVLVVSILSNTVEIISDIVAASRNHSSSKKEKAPSTTSTPASPPPPNNKKDNQNNQRNPNFRSKRLYDKNGIKVDYEYFGNGQYSIHIHTPSGKFYYDVQFGAFRVENDPQAALAPTSIQRYLDDMEIVAALLKAYKIVMSLGGL